MKMKTKKINKHMTFAELIKENQEASEVLASEGMHCYGCPMAQFENLEQGCISHGLDTEKILNKLRKKEKKRLKK